MSGISKKPKSKVLSEADVDALINKGGDVPAKEKQPPKKVRIKKPTGKKIPVQLRLSKDLLDVIDGLIDDRVVRVSRHTWFMEAIADKINKEKSKE